MLPQLTAAGSLTPLTAAFSNPPTTADLEAIRAKLNAIIPVPGEEVLAEVRRLVGR